MGPEASALNQGSGSQITDWDGVELALRKELDAFVDSAARSPPAGGATL